VGISVGVLTGASVGGGGEGDDDDGGGGEVGTGVAVAPSTSAGVGEDVRRDEVGIAEPISEPEYGDDQRAGVGDVYGREVGESRSGGTVGISGSGVRVGVGGAVIVIVIVTIVAGRDPHPTPPDIAGAANPTSTTPPRIRAIPPQNNKLRLSTQPPHDQQQQTEEDHPNPPIEQWGYTDAGSDATAGGGGRRILGRSSRADPDTAALAGVCLRLHCIHRLNWFH